MDYISANSKLVKTLKENIPLWNRWRKIFKAKIDLRCANLYYSDLSGADLRCANFHGADLQGADLRGANLEGIFFNTSTSFFFLQCPEEGSFIAWKKCNERDIVKLLIPEDAKRSSATSRKCRASKAIVLEIISNTNKNKDMAVSSWDSSFFYRKGDTVEVEDFDENRWNECSTGIHFFMTKIEAENY